MSIKDDFIHRLSELIDEGETVLQTKGNPQEIIDENAKGRLLDTAFWVGVGTYEEKQAYLNANKHMFTSVHIPINYEYSMNWILQVYRCLMRYLGNNDKMTLDMEWYTDKTTIEKKHIERILIKLKATKVAVENGDVVMENEKVCLGKNCKNCHYLILKNIENDGRNTTSTDTLTFDIRNNLSERISKGFGLNTNGKPAWIDCLKRMWNIDRVSTHEELDQVVSKARDDCYFFAMFQENLSLEAFIEIENEKKARETASVKEPTQVVIFEGNVNRLQLQQGTNNSSQSMTIDESIDFEKVSQIFNQILENLESLGLSSLDQEQLKNIVSESKSILEKKSNGTIAKSLSVIKDILLRASGSLVAQGILYGLQQL